VVAIFSINVKESLRLSDLGLVLVFRVCSMDYIMGNEYAYCAPGELDKCIQPEAWPSTNGPQAANASRYWPTGRGIFHNAEKTFLVRCGAVQVITAQCRCGWVRRTTCA
jgi:hypothetical protein